MSHPMYNPRGGLFSSGQRSMVTGQYVLGSQSGLDLSGPRLAPESTSSSHGGMMVNQQRTFPLGQRQAQISHDLEASIDMNIRGAREEMRLVTQMMHQPKTADPQLKKGVRDKVFSPADSGFAAASISRRSGDVDWTEYQAPSKLFSSTSSGYSSGSSQRFQSSNFGEQSSLDSSPSEYQSTRYTPESANSILEKFGLSSDDLELLSLYPDDQLTPDNLPYILRDIRVRKAERTARDRDVRPSDRLLSEKQQGKVIDYGHSSKFGLPEEKKDSYEREHHTKGSPKYGIEVTGSSLRNTEKTKCPQQTPAAPARAKPSDMVAKLQQPPLMSSRPSTQSVDIQVAKTILGRMPTAPPVLPLTISRPPPTTSLAGSPLTSMVPMVSGSSFTFATPQITASSAKRFPTPTMMNDYSAATPRIFPHTCSLCNIECAQIKDWIEHQNTNHHIESCRRLRKQYPDWKAETVAATRTETKLEHHSPKHRTSSRSYSRTPSPKRHHGSSSRHYHSRSRSRSRSRSPRRYRRRSRSRSRSWSPRKSRGSPSYRWRSRSPPPRRSKSPVYSSSRRSPVWSTRRESTRKSSPSHRQRSSSSERLAKKLLESSELSSVSDSSSLKAMVQSLAPALLAELAKKRTTSLPSGKGSLNRRRSSSPSLKRSESSKSSCSSAMKISSSKSDKSRKSAGPGTSCLLRLKHIPVGTTHEELHEAVEPFGKIYTAILLKKIKEASVCMEREEDAKALANCKNLMLHGKLIEICMEKDTKNEPKSSAPPTKFIVKRKEPQPATERQMSTSPQTAKTKEVSKPSKLAKGKLTVKAETLSKSPGEAQGKRIVKKEIPWKKNVVEITGLPEAGVTEEELTNLASPYGFIAKPVIAVAQQKAYLEMPNSEAAQSMVKAYAETPAKLQEKGICVKMMTKPVDLKYTESIFRALMGMDKLPLLEKATLPERLLSVSNIPYQTEAIAEVQNLVQHHGSYKHCLPLNGRIIFEMDTALIAKSVCSRFIKLPCVIQDNPLIFRLVRASKFTDQIKKKPDAAGAKSVSKAGVKTQVKALPTGTKITNTVAPSATITTSALATSAEARAGLEAGCKPFNEIILIESSDSKGASTSIKTIKCETEITDTKAKDIYLVEIEESMSRESGLCQVTTAEAMSTTGLAGLAKELPVDTNEHGEKLQINTSGSPEQAHMEETEQAEKSHAGQYEQAEKPPREGSEQAEELPMEVTEHAEGSLRKESEQAEELPREDIEHAEEAPKEGTKQAEESQIEATVQPGKLFMEESEKVESPPREETEKAEDIPMEVTDQAGKSPVDAANNAANLLIETTEHSEKLPIDTAEQAKNSCCGRPEFSHGEAAPTAGKGPLVPKEIEISKLTEASVELPFAEETDTMDVTSSQEKTISYPGLVEMEIQKTPIEESAQSSEVSQNDLKAKDTENKTEIQDEFESKPVQSYANFRAPDQSQPFENPVEAFHQDIPPVTQEILKALEAAVHQCRLQSSLKRAEEQARSKTEEEEKNTSEKDIAKAQASSKKATTSNKPPQANKDTESQRSRQDKGRKHQSSGSRSKHGKSPSPGRESSSRSRDKNSPEAWSPTIRHGRSSGSFSTGSRKSRADSPVSKRSRERADGTKTRSTSRSARSLRSDTRAKKSEILKVDDPEEIFPFNLDEFVTVDEVTDEVEEHKPQKSSKSSSKPKVSQDHATKSTSKKKLSLSSSDANFKKGEMPPVSSTRQTRKSAKAALDILEKQAIDSKTDIKMKEPEKLTEPQRALDNDATTKTQEKAAHQTAFGEVQKEECEPTGNVLMSGGKEKDCKTQKHPKESRDNGPTKRGDFKQFVLSTSTVEAQPFRATDVQKTVTSLEHQSGMSDMEVQELENRDLPPHDSLVTLDEVCDEDVTDDMAFEELLRDQSNENPVALLTIETDDDETEEEQLEKALQGLVTLDEIVAEDEDEEDRSFKTETLGTANSIRKDGKGTKQDQSKCDHSEAPTQKDGLVKSTFLEEDSHDLEELHSMNFVTVDEVGEEEEEKEEELLQEKVEKEAPVTRRAGRTRKRTRPASVRKSTRGRKRKSGNQKEVPDTSTMEKPASDATVPSPSTKSVDQKHELQCQNMQVEETSDSASMEIFSGTEEEKPGVSKQEREVTMGALSERRLAIKEASKLRREVKLNQEPEYKKTCIEPSIAEDFTLPPFSPENPIGVDFVVPKTGFFCKLCSLFYGNEETAKNTHCSSLRHYQNMQKYYEKLKTKDDS